jgi:GH15 family glucan-1,4-alpha-glucosidase
MTKEEMEILDWEQADIFRDPLVHCDFRSESLGGGTNAIGALGNGRLTVGISPWSELIYFRWPTPSYYDHLRYFTKAYGLKGALFLKDVRWGKNAPSLDWRRYGRPYEVYPGLGARGGIYFEKGDLSWLGDQTWTSSRQYKPDGGPNLCTQLLRNKTKIEVCQWVDYNYDLLVQEFKIKAKFAEKFFYYATFAPSKRLDPNLGVPDSKKSGFAAINLPKQSTILFFQPQRKNKNQFSPYLDEKLLPKQIDDLSPEGGIFIAMSLLNPPDRIQIGADRRGRSISKNAPMSASENAMKGQLNGNTGFIGPIDAGYERILEDEETKVTILTAIADNAVNSVKIVTDAQIQGINLLKQKTIKYWLNLSEKVNLSPQAKTTEKRVAQRSITNLLIGSDRNSGAIIASPSRQPAYHFDWPRDGAFFDLALDLAGISKVVDQHLDFYRRTQRKNRFSVSLMWLLGLRSPFYSPCGHWHANLYTDGKKGNLSIIPYEIDETSLIIWDLWRHEHFIQEIERSTYQSKFLEVLELAANAVNVYIKKRKGWIRRGFEDDNLIPHATLHGAAAVLVGLASAVDAGKRWGADPKQVERWRTSAIALRNGILRRIENKPILKKSGWRGIQWSLFPAPLFEHYNDERAKLFIDQLTKEVQEKTERKQLGYGYLAEQVFILNIVASKKPEIRPLLSRAVNEVINSIPISGSDCYGEVTLWINMPGESKLIPQQRTSIPHLWTGVCAYLTVESYYRPERFLTQIPPIPK